ncbi:MAG: hypothetical protein L6Q99_20560 [Planctomycetes bacterium]|nr:hypothetical protein [Planctomycetota bacterium]
MSLVACHWSLVAGRRSPVAGAQVAAQGWSRDPASPSTTNLKAVTSFVVMP